MAMPRLAYYGTEGSFSRRILILHDRRPAGHQHCSPANQPSWIPRRAIRRSQIATSSDLEGRVIVNSNGIGGIAPDWV